MENNSPIVALVGPPNVGKSTLLNKMAGKKLAITSPEAGTTRDRQYVDLTWNDKTFTFVDTAGLEINAKDELSANIQKQIEIAVQQADLIVLLVDGREPVGALSSLTLKKFRNLKKTLILAVNKLDSPKHWETQLVPFHRLGIKKIFPVSALTGRGIGDLLDGLVNLLPASAKNNREADAQTGNQAIAISIVGKPNVGKSSLFNAILKEQRVVVSALPGTTRAAIDSQIQIGGQAYTFIDTAGLKKKTYRQQESDLYGGFQTFKAIRRSDVCFLVIDAQAELTKQDQRVAAEIFNMHKGCIVVANKIDLYTPAAREKIPAKSLKQDWRTDDSYLALQDYISLHFPFLWMCPVFFVSAQTGQGLEKALGAVVPTYQRRQKQIDNQTLSEFLFRKLKTNAPQRLRDQKIPKVFSLHQVEINPPKFELLVNHPAAISQQFRRFLENSIIKELDFWGTPIVLRLKGKDKT